MTEPQVKKPTAEKKAAEKIEDDTITQTRSEARTNKVFKEEKPEKVTYVAREVLANGIRSVKVVKLEVIPKLGTRSSLVARLAMKNGKWQPTVGRAISQTVKDACAKAGIKLPGAESGKGSK